MRRTTSHLANLVIFVILASVAPIAISDGYPERDITYVVPYTPGGTNDNIARRLGILLSERLGQNIVIENRAGAGGTIGASYVAHADPDGHTILNTSIGNLAIAPQLVDTNFDPFEDIKPVAFIGNSRSVIAVNNELPVETLQELVEYSQAHPGQLNFGSSGNGTPGHIIGEYFKSLSGADLTHVPYRGSAQALADVNAGVVQVVFDPLANGYVKAGRLKGLAFLGADSAPDLPDVPSITEAGFEHWDPALSGSFFISVPSQTPDHITEHLREAFDAVLAEQETQDALRAMGVEPQRLEISEIEERIRSIHDISADIIAGIE